MRANRRALVSWSGGKDSCLAAHRAMSEGLRVERLLAVLEEDADRSRSHALPEYLLRAQADALGAEFVGVRASWQRYEEVFVAALLAARTDGIEVAVFGDIDLVPHRDWEERVCAIAGVEARLPLWGEPRTAVVAELLGQGYEAVCVCVNARFLPAEFCGRRYDESFLQDLPAGVDACGENGEFHTYVTAAPGFRRRIGVQVRGRRRYDAPASQGADTFWFADLELA